WIDTSRPEIKAAVFRTERGILVIPIWVGPGAQFVPGQAATANLKLVVPQVPVGTQVGEVTPGEMRALRSERVRGGRQVTVPEFGLTTALVFTADNGPTGLVVRLQDQVRRMRKSAAQWSYDLARAELEKVEQVYGELEKAGHPLPDGPSLLNHARQRVQTCADHWQGGDY